MTTAENRRDYWREWKRHKRQTDPRYRAQNRAAALRWAKENPGAHAAKNHRRRARLIGAAGWSYTTATHIAARFAMFGNRCAYCGSADALTIDHRIPLVRGGAHWPANIVPACKSCNSSKGQLDTRGRSGGRRSTSRAAA